MQILNRTSEDLTGPLAKHEVHYSRGICQMVRWADYSSKEVRGQIGTIFESRLRPCLSSDCTVGQNDQVQGSASQLYQL